MTVDLTIILVSFAILMAAYLFVSARDGSYLNVLTPTFATLVPTSYFLDVYGLVTFGPAGTKLAYIICYSSFAAEYVGLAIGYSVAVPALRLPFAEASAQDDRSSSRLPAYLWFLLAIALFLPIMLHFGAQILSPRAVYEQTRTGYGINFFLSSAACYMALVQILCTRSVGRLELALFILTAVVFLWLHGSKGPILTVIFIVALHSVYIGERRFTFLRSLRFGAFLLAAGLIMFLVTTPALLLNGGVESLRSYSGYTRNDMLVIDSDLAPTYGRLTLENQLYARVPRVLFPDKPNDYGIFYLAEHFFPDAFALGQGAPAFQNGTLFADFGGLAPLVILILGFLRGLMMKTIVNGTRKFRGPGDMVMLLFACGLSVIPFLYVFLLPENYLLAAMANSLKRLRLATVRAPERSVVRS